MLAGLPHGYAVPFPDSSTLGMSPRGHAPVALTTDSGRSDERCRLQPLQLSFWAEMQFQCTCSNGQQRMYPLMRTLVSHNIVASVRPT